MLSQLPPITCRSARTARRITTIVWELRHPTIVSTNLDNHWSLYSHLPPIPTLTHWQLPALWPTSHVLLAHHALHNSPPRPTLLAHHTLHSRYSHAHHLHWHHIVLIPCLLQLLKRIKTLTPWH